jgi:hypothetical protein
MTPVVPFQVFFRQFVRPVLLHLTLLGGGLLVAGGWLLNLISDNGF